MDVAEKLRAALADRYAIERELGQGGMATVYLARDLKHDRQVALKVLRPELAATLGLDRFLLEIKTTAQLTHPHILPLLDSGGTGELLYYVMPYVEGESLRDRLTREKQLPLDDALQVTREVADALSYAHAHGVIHRDIKPENILLQSGHAVVADFGIAKAIAAAGSERLTQTGLAVGTPAYMSPEQAAGSQDLDGRSDIYSLGSVLYEMLSGEAPYTGPTPQAILAKKLSEPTPRISVVRESVPRGVEAALNKALSKTPADRFVTAAVFAAALAHPDTLSGQAGGTVPRHAGKPVRRRWIAGVAALAIAGAALVALDVSGLRGRLVGPAGAPPRAIKLAVLPFENLTGDPSQEYLSDGVTQEMISALGRLHPQGLSVIARTSVMRYKKSNTPIDQIGRELGVDYVLEGSAQREAGHVRISAELIQVRDQIQLWADVYDRQFAGILILQADVAKKVAGALALKLLPAEQARLASVRNVNPEAYDAYLKGSHYWPNLTPADLDTAQRYFELALTEDPNYAPAYAGIAIVLASRTQMGWAAPAESGPKAKEAARKAVELDESFAEAHFALATVLTYVDWDWARAEPEWKRTIELNPNYPDALVAHSLFLQIVGRPDEAMRQAERALALDPFNLVVQFLYAADLLFVRRYDEAITQARATLRQQPGSVAAFAALWIAYRGKRMEKEALAGARDYYAVYGSPDFNAALDRGYAEAGYAGAMRRAGAALAAHALKGNVSPVDVADLYVEAGDNDRAIEWLQKGFVGRDPNMTYLNNWPQYDRLRSDPRFQDLLRRMGLPRR